MENLKRCKECGIEKDVGEFSKQKLTKDGLQIYCKKCSGDKMKQWRLNNPKRAKESKRQYDLTRKEPSKLYRQKYFQDNKEQIYIRKNKRYKQRILTDVNYKISKYCRRIVRRVLGGNKTKHTMIYFMCTQEEFKLHIERQFEPWMNWGNRGYGPGKWVIDHIIPISHFNMSDETEKYMCCRYQNLRPLSWEKNLAKGNSVPNINP